MRTRLLIMLAPAWLSACQGLEPLPKATDSGGADGAGSDDDGTVQLGDLRIEPGTVEFGVVGLGVEESQTVVLSNTGEEAIIVRQASLDGDAQFEVKSTTTLPLQLEEGGEVVIDVSFVPDAADTYSAGLTLDVNTLEEPYVVSVTGAGEGAVIDTGDTDTDDPPTGSLTAAPTPVDFGEIPTNRAGTEDVTITNTSSDNILIQQITGSPSEFGYQLGGDITLPQVIAPDESRTLTLTFDPAAEIPYSGNVELTLDAAGTPASLAIPVQGVGIEPPCDICAPIVTVSPNPVSITVPIRCSGSETVNITNVGDQDLDISDIWVTNDTFFACGTLSLGTGSTTATLAPGASHSIEVNFDATAPLCTENPNLSRDTNVLHIQNNSGQPDYTVEVSAFAGCPGGA